MADDQQDPKIIKDYLLDAITTFDTAIDYIENGRSGYSLSNHQIGLCADIAKVRNLTRIIIDRRLNND